MRQKDSQNILRIPQFKKNANKGQDSCQCDLCYSDRIYETPDLPFVLAPKAWPTTSLKQHLSLQLPVHCWCQQIPNHYPMSYHPQLSEWFFAIHCTLPIDGPMKTPYLQNRGPPITSTITSLICISLLSSWKSSSLLKCDQKCLQL
jgi:hypothetical protein